MVIEKKNSKYGWKGDGNGPSTVRADLLGKQEQAGSTKEQRRRFGGRAEEVDGCGKHHSPGQKKNLYVRPECPIPYFILLEYK